MLDFALSFLHFLALLFFIRLALPQRYLLLNPYAAAMDYQVSRLLNFVQTGIALPTKGVCAFLFLLTLAGRATLLAKYTDPLLTIAPHAIFTFNPSGFIGWFALETLHFLYFYLTLLSAYFLLRLWHGFKHLPGHTGDLLHLAIYPFSRLKLPHLLLALPLLGGLLFALVHTFASDALYPTSEIFNYLAQQHANSDEIDFLRPVMEIQNLPTIAWALFMILNTIVAATLELLDTLFLFLLLSLFSAFTPAPRTSALATFVKDAILLICGPIRNLHIGPVNIAPIAAYFTISLLYILLVTLITFFILGVTYVV